MFDDQCNFAAVVYGVNDDSDRLLLDFTEDIRRSGLRVTGLVQLGRNHRPDYRELRTMALSNGEVVPVAHDPDAGATRCGLDRERLAGIASTHRCQLGEFAASWA